MKRTILILIIVLILAAGGYYLWYGEKNVEAVRYVAVSSNGSSTLLEQSIVTMGSSTFRVSIADTFDARAHGLSDTLSLEPDGGLLFAFEEDKKWGFWMKDMNYAIDMVWISASSTIVDVKSHATPDSYPVTYFPKKDSRYVLEINDGLFAKTGAKIGDSVQILRN